MFQKPTKTFMLLETVVLHQLVPQTLEFEKNCYQKTFSSSLSLYKLPTRSFQVRPFSTEKRISEKNFLGPTYFLQFGTYFCCRKTKIFLANKIKTKNQMIQPLNTIKLNFFILNSIIHFGKNDDT